MALFTFEDESDRIDPQGSDFDFGPNVFQNRDWFTLFEPVGFEGRNRRDDTIKVESLLGNAGYFDLDRTEGPTGYWGLRADQGLREFQTDHGLEADGLVLPSGPTLKALHGKVGGLLQGFPAPTPDEVDDHHQRLGEDKPGLIRFGRPALKLPPAPELDFESAQANTRLTDHLLGLGNDGDFPSFAQRHIEQDGAPAIAQYHDLIARLGQRDRGRAHRLAWSILDRLPEDLASQFAGGAIPPIGPLAIRQQDAPEEIWPKGEGTLLYDPRAWAGRLPPSDDDAADPPSARPEDAGEIGEGGSLAAEGARPLPYFPGEDEGPKGEALPYKPGETGQWIIKDGRRIWVDGSSAVRLADEGGQPPAAPPSEKPKAGANPQPAPEGQAPQPGQSSGQTPGAGAEGGTGAGAEKNQASPKLTAKEIAEIADVLKDTAERGREIGFELAADLLDRYRNNSGEPYYVSVDEAFDYPGTHRASAEADAKLAGLLNDPTSDFGVLIADFANSDDATRTLDVRKIFGYGASYNPVSDGYLAMGTVHVEANGKLTMTKASDGSIEISGTLSKRMSDQYDFNKNGDGLANWIKDKVPLVPTQFGGKALTREEIDRFEKSGGAAPFEIRSAPWKEKFRATIDPNFSNHRINDALNNPNKRGLPMAP